MRIKKQSLILFIFFGFSHQIKAFDITDLPPRTPVTLTSSTKIKVPSRHRARLKATHKPQTLRFSSPQSQKIKIAIYNPKRERVHYITTHPSQPVLYQMQGLGHIDIIPQPNHSGTSHPQLEVTSDWPLEISH